MIKQRGTMFVLTGPSGVGKGTLLNKVLPEQRNLFLSVSATTRTPRPGEKDGISYFFLTREQFKDKIARGEFLEYAEFSGNWYGTPLGPIQKRLAQGEDVILEIEVQGAMQIREKVPEAAMIFVAPPDFSTLESRLRGRQTEDEETVQKRLDTAKWELQQIPHFDYLVENDSLEQAKAQLEMILHAERCRTTHRRFEG